MVAQNVSESWERGDPYEQYVGRWSRKLAPLFLGWLGIPAGRRWLDVGCGTGALTTTILDHCAPASVTGIEPSEGFLATAKGHLADRATLRHGSATAIPLDDACVDVVVSGLVLNFIPDPRVALVEMARVTASGGTLGAYVWDYAGRMDLMRHFWDAATELDPAVVSLDEGKRFPMCRAEAMVELFHGAGLADVEVTAIDIATPFASFDDYWRPFLGGQGPAPSYAMALDPAARTRLRDSLRQRLTFQANGSLQLMARAWAARATVKA